MWAVEGCMDQRKGFHTVDDFIKTAPMQRSGILGITEFVDRRLAGQSVTEITLIDVAQQLRTHAETTLDGLRKIRRKTPKPSKQLRLTLEDIEAMAHLGNYYSSKISGAERLGTFRKSNVAADKAAAIEHLRKAVEHWTAYATVADRLYHPQLLARTRHTDWTAILDDVKQDVAIAQRAGGE